MYVALFVVGLACSSPPPGSAPRALAASPRPLFAGLSAATLLAPFVRNPLRSLEENLQFITWLGVIYNTHWTRLLCMDQKPSTLSWRMPRATLSARSSG